MAGYINNNAERCFKRLLELDTIRGPHSTGVLSVSPAKVAKVVKRLGTPWDFYDSREAYDLLNRKHNILLGHNRWATKGAVNKDNAHPFEFSNLIGAHNGTLRSVHNLDNNKDYEVDSENLYHHMNTHGVHATIPIVDGAFALTWYDKKEETINLIRNNERTLFYTFNKDKDLLLWASEEWMLLVACNYADIKIEKPIALNPGTLYTFEVPFSYASKKFEAVRLRTLELRKPPTVTGCVKQETKPTTTTNKTVVPFKVKKPAHEFTKHLNKWCTFFVGKSSISSAGQHFIECWLVEDEDIAIRVFAIRESQQWNEMLNSTGYFRAFVQSFSTLENGYLTIDIRTMEHVAAVVEDDLEELVPGFENELIDEKTFDERSYKGCAWCGSPVLFNEAHGVVWIDKTECLCPDCAEEPSVKQYLTLN